MTNLQQLSLANNGIKNINPLSNMKKLREICLNRNSLRSIDALSDLPCLEIIEVRNNRLTDISMDGFNELILLDIRSNAFSTLKFLTRTKKLLELCKRF